MTTVPVIEARALGRRYGESWAIRGIDLDLAPGEMLGVVGPDGAGKTTLLQMLAAILDPSEGECRVFGFDTRRRAKAIAARLGYMTQGFTLYDRLSVDENLLLAARLRGLDRATYTQRRAQLLAMAGLEGFGTRAAGKLSGGMRKKLSLCTNLVHQPELLILDEPGLGVDPLSRRQLWEMLAQFRARGVAMVVATSYMDEAERCGRVLLLREGQVIAADTPAAVRQRARGRVFEAFAERPVTLAQRLRALPGVRSVQVLPDRVRLQRDPVPEAAGVPAAGLALQPAEPTLEDVFVLSADAAPEAADNEPRSTSTQLPAGQGVRTEALTVRYDAFIAVDAVSIQANPGELLALLGPNGAGKTTLIRALCGLVGTAGGRGEIAGVALGGDVAALRQRIGYMSQRFSLYLDLTPAENLAFFASAYGLSGEAAERAIAWTCTRIGLDRGERRRVAALSGASRQRLALACSLLHRPAVLFLDEPTSGVDPLARIRFWGLIRSLAASGMTIVVTTHYLDEVAYCDRIGLMHRGRLIALGTLPELRESTGSEATASIESVFVRAIERVEATTEAA
jgi:ABC-2 type transport system ATP-binding protein